MAAHEHSGTTYAFFGKYLRYPSMKEISRKICLEFSCGKADIMEFVPDEEMKSMSKYYQSPL